MKCVTLPDLELPCHPLCTDICRWPTIRDLLLSEKSTIIPSRRFMIYYWAAIRALRIYSRKYEIRRLKNRQRRNVDSEFDIMKIYSSPLTIFPLQLQFFLTSSFDRRKTNLESDSWGNDENRHTIYEIIDAHISRHTFQ